MARFTQLFVVATILAVVSCRPFKFGGGGRASSHTTFGGEGAAEVGGQDLVAGRAKGYVNWTGGSKGGLYVGETGYGGYVGSSVGGEVGGKSRGGGTVGANDGYNGYAGGEGSLDADGHAFVHGDLHGYDANEIGRMNKKNSETYNRAFGRNNQEEGYGAMKGDYDW